MMKFKVIREMWCRGGFHGSRLLTDRGTRCCLGFFAQQVRGIGDDLIKDIATPLQYRTSTANKPTAPGFPAEFYAENAHSEWADTLIRINDSVSLTDSEREQMLTETFAEKGYTVEFI